MWGLTSNKLIRQRERQVAGERVKRGLLCRDREIELWNECDAAHYNEFQRTAKTDERSNVRWGKLSKSLGCHDTNILVLMLLKCHESLYFFYHVKNCFAFKIYKYTYIKHNVLDIWSFELTLIFFLLKNDLSLSTSYRHFVGFDNPTLHYMHICPYSLHLFPSLSLSLLLIIITTIILFIIIGSCCRNWAVMRWGHTQTLNAESHYRIGEGEQRDKSHLKQKAKEVIKQHWERLTIWERERKRERWKDYRFLPARDCSRCYPNRSTAV